MNLKNILLDLIYPRGNHCLNCNKNIIFTEVEGLCPECLDGIRFIRDYCEICGREITGNKSICERCSTNPPSYDLARGITVYCNTIKDIILKFKYYNQTELTVSLGRLLVTFYYKYYQGITIDYIIPIPLHKEREKIRGYNQAALLAEQLSKEVDIPLAGDLLKRVKNSPPLYNLAPRMRCRVLRNVFAVDGQQGVIRGSNVLLIDDIFTTGATVNEAARVLKKGANIRSVYVLTISTASP